MKEGEASYYEKTITRDSSQQGAMSGAALACSGIRQSAMIIHGSAGCGWAARWMRSDHVLSNYVPIIATSLLEHEFILGATEKLRRTTEWAIQKWKPKCLFIINGDTGSLINDPIENVAKEYEDKYHIPIIAMDCPYFMGLEATGVDYALSAVLKRFAREDVEKGDNNIINIIGPYLMGSNNWVYDFYEIKRLLIALGLKINCVLTYNTSLEEISNFNRAGTNLYLTYETLPQLHQYEDEYGITRIGQNLPLPIGIVNTEDWYYGIANEFGKKERAEEVLKRYRKTLKGLKFLYNSSWLLTWLSNKYAAVIGPATWASSFANFLYFDLSLYPAVIALYGGSEETIEKAKENLKELGKYYNPVILENPLYIQVVEAAKDCKVQFSVGQTQEKSMMEGNGISHLALAGIFSVLGAYNFIPYPSMGYRGVLYLLTMMGRIVEETFHEPQRWRDLRYRGREEE